MLSYIISVTDVLIEQKVTATNLYIYVITIRIYGTMAKLAYALALRASSARIGGSSPSGATEFHMAMWWNGIHD